MIVLPALINGWKPTSAPAAFVTLRVTRVSRSSANSAVPSIFRTASLNVMVMFALSAMFTAPVAGAKVAVGTAAAAIGVPQASTAKARIIGAIDRLVRSISEDYSGFIPFLSKP